MSSSSLRVILFSRALSFEAIEGLCAPPELGLERLRRFVDGGAGGSARTSTP